MTRKPGKTKVGDVEAPNPGNTQNAREDINELLNAHFPKSQLAKRDIIQSTVKQAAVALASATAVNLFLDHASKDFPMDEDKMPADGIQELRVALMEALKRSGMGETTATQVVSAYEAEAAMYLANKLGLTAPPQSLPWLN